MWSRSAGRLTVSRCSATAEHLVDIFAIRLTNPEGMRLGP